MITDYSVIEDRWSLHVLFSMILCRENKYQDITQVILLYCIGTIHLQIFIEYVDDLKGSSK